MGAQAGWSLDEALSPGDRGAGFDGSVFFSGDASSPSEIVIAFRGPDIGIIDWTMGNVPAASGYA